MWLSEVSSAGKKTQAGLIGSANGNFHCDYERVEPVIKGEFVVVVFVHREHGLREESEGKKNLIYISRVLLTENTSVKFITQCQEEKKKTACP